MKSKITKRRRSKSSADEHLRCQRLSDLRKLALDRFGPTLPNTWEGRQYLKQLLLPISLGPCTASRGRGVVKVWGPIDRMRHEIERWTPWMEEDEVEEVINEIEEMPTWQRKPLAKTLGKRLGLTFEVRDRLKIKTIRACNISQKALAVIRKQRKRHCDERRRRARGAKPRAEFLAASFTQTKPWIAAGFKTRRTWERNGKPSVASPRQVNLIKAKLALATKVDLSTDANAVRCVRPSTATHAEQPLTCVIGLTAGSSQWRAA